MVGACAYMLFCSTLICVGTDFIDLPEKGFANWKSFDCPDVILCARARVCAYVRACV